MATPRSAIGANRQKHWTKAALAALALSLAAPVAAQDRDCLAKEQAAAETISGGAVSATDCLRESLTKVGPVSGNAASRLRGLMASTAFAQGYRVQTRAFEIHVGTPGALCVRYLGRDGRYSGSQNFAVRRAGWVRVPFDTAYGQQLASLGREGLSVQAETGPDCNKSQGRRLAPVRVAGSAGAFALIAQVGADDDAQLMVYPADKGKPAPFRCDRIVATDSAIRYNTVCAVPTAALQSGARAVLDIRGPRRERYAVPLAPLLP